MHVKTETSSPSPISSSDPFTPPKEKRKAIDTNSGSSTSSSDKKPSSAKSSSKKAKSSPATGTMTPAIKEALIDHMMRIACSAIKKEDLAIELGISKKQLDNAICSGRVNLRSKLVTAAREL